MLSSRIAGWPLIVGAALLIIAQIPQTVLFGGSDEVHYAQHVLFVPTGLVSVAGGLLVLWALPLLYGSPRARGLGTVGRVGTVLVFLGASAFGIFLSVLSAMVLPFLALHAPGVLGQNGPPGFFEFFLAAEFCVVLGAILLSIPLVRGKAFSRWPGYVLLASAVLGILGFVIQGPNSSSEIGIIASGLSSFLLFIGLGGIGWHLVSRPTPREAMTGAE